ncbi:MAG: dihydroorotase, partial [Gammaproteobacteria bacterium]
MKILLLNGLVVNEDQERVQDILIENERIARIDSDLSGLKADEVIEAEGCWVLPGMIDDQVHFREPGLTHKGTIASESRAAVAGGITSFMDMPNVTPVTANAEELAAKHARAAAGSYANYSFYLGATHDNLEHIKSADPHRVCAVKVFMGSSTGNLLVDDPKVLHDIFAHTPVPVATHCEDTPTIMAREAEFKARYGEAVPARAHADIRSREACLTSTRLALDLASQHDTPLHVLHISTAEEVLLFEPGPIQGKRITAEACVHHTFFSETDYDRLGHRIKCNPSIKTERDRLALLEGLRTGRLDIIATDHAPHTLEEKERSYWDAPSGLPLVQHALLAALELVHDETLSLPELVRKMSHNVAARFQILERGYLREGYFADIAIVRADAASVTSATDETALYQCGWTPFIGRVFRSKVVGTLVNGAWAFRQLGANGEPILQRVGVYPLAFD